MEPLSPRARDALSAYRRDHALSPAHHQRLREQLAGRLAPAVPDLLPEASKAVATGRSALGLSKMAAFGALLTAVVVGLFVSERAKPQPTSSPSSVVRAVSVVVPPVSPPAPAPLLSVKPDLRSGAPSAPKLEKRLPLRRKLRTSSSASSDAVAVVASSSGEVAAPAHIEQQVGAPAPLRAHASNPEVEPAHGALAEARAHARTHSATLAPDAPTKQARPPESEASLDEEVLSLRRAHELAKRGEPLRALSALSDHARRFPAGKLIEAAQVARLSVLCDLGRPEAAQVAASQFLARYPASLYGARVRRVCAADR